MGPFRPGPGGLPPYLAGREAEQDLFHGLLEDLRNGLAPPSEVVLYGPRGNGKTSLLGWIAKEAAAGSAVDALRLAPSYCRDEAALVERLLPDSFWQRLKPAEIEVSGIAWRPGRAGPPSLDRALATRVRKKPLVLLLDEAHTLDREVGNVLLNASQIVGRELPFLLVLAGTPDLRARLATMSASFWNRAEKIALGRLDEAASAKAIERPLADEGIGIEQDALARIGRESHGYPYFVQLWGSVVWRRVPDAGSGAGRVTTATVEAAAPEFESRKDSYYLDRYEELRKLDMLPLARAVADAFAAVSWIPDERLEQAIRDGLSQPASRDQAVAAEETLRHLGLVWRAASRPLWEPGIPSLMDYLREHIPPAASRSAPA